MKKKTLLLASFLLTMFISQAQTVSDYDGNVYNTVKIGSQEWMKENLKVTHYRNGNVIPNIEDQSAWNNLVTGARCYYFNDSVSNASEYGALYNWWAVTDYRNLCPERWHVPTDSEWHTLVHTIDSNAQSIVGIESSIAGGEMKEVDTSHWNSPNVGATNSSGFTALPGGRRFSQGYYPKGLKCYFWSSSPAFMGHPWFRSIHQNNASVERWGNPEYNGQSIRCVRDSLFTQIKETNSAFHIMFELYPNPSRDRVFIKTSENYKLKIELFDITGRCIFLENSYNKENGMDLSEIKKGVYIIKLSANDKIGIKKLIKK